MLIKCQAEQFRLTFFIPLRVAFRARVPTDRDQQISNLKNQLPCCIKLIQGKPSRTYAAGYPSAASSASMMVNPAAKNSVPRLECSPADASGISSSTTT